MKLHGVVVIAALNCFQASFCNWLIFHVFRFGVRKPTLMVCLITLVVISFRFYINISKLNMLLWAAVLWLSCCNCCVETLFIMTKCIKEVRCIFQVAVFLTIDDLGSDIFLLFLSMLRFLESELFLRYPFSSH